MEKNASKITKRQNNKFENKDLPNSPRRTGETAGSGSKSCSSAGFKWMFVLSWWPPNVFYTPEVSLYPALAARFLQVRFTPPPFIVR